MDSYKFIIKTIEKAGELLLKRTKGGFKIGIKDNDPKNIVTEVDLEINNFIIKEIKKKFPLHGIYSEESENKENDREYVWTIDPIDGTSNFSRGIPHFAICLGLLKNGVPIAGAVYNPITKEIFSFEKGKGAYLNSKKISVSSIAELSRAFVFFHTGRNSKMQKWGGETYRKLLNAALKTSNFSSSALDVCYVASGRIEANIYGTFTSYDITPALGILWEAGGIAVNKKGEPLKLSKNPEKVVMANNKKISDELLKIINN